MNISQVLCGPLCHSKLSSQPFFALLLKESSSADWLGRKELFCLLLELCKSGLITDIVSANGNFVSH